MRLLLDQSFPESALAIAQFGRVVTERWTGDAIGDTELLQIAADRGFDAVVFLGRTILAEPSTLAVAVVRGIRVVVTSSEEPLKATRDIENHLSTVVRLLSDGAWVIEVLAGQVRSIASGSPE